MGALENTQKKSLKNLLQQGQTFTVAALLVLVVFLTVINNDFLSYSNLSNIGRQFSINAIISVGMTFVILEGSTDLSVGSVMALSGTMMAAFMINYNMPVPVAILLGVLIGAACGLVTGIVVAYAKVPGIIASLAMMEVARGLALIYTGGYPMSGVPEAFKKIGNGNVFGIIPTPLLFTVVIYLVAWVLLNRSKVGRYVYALGGNEEAARLSGIKVAFYKALPFFISGITAACAGIIATSRTGSGQPNSGVGFELDAIAAVVLGGTAISGGRGHIFGTVLGALLLGVLSNGLNFLGVTPYVQRVIKGAIIIIAVIISSRNDD